MAAALGAWLAQPAYALALRWWAHSSPRQRAGAGDVVALLLLWGVAPIAAAALVAWPLSALRSTGSLGAALGLSAAAGIGVVALWRAWPLWQAAEREGGPIGRHWRNLSERDWTALRGAGVAGIVAIALAMHLLLAWPGLLPSSPLRWALAVVAVVLWPLLHGLLQRIEPASALPMPIVDMPTAEPPAPEPVPDDLGAALYQAARGGRVDRALELLDLGADPHALPPAADRDQRSLPVLAAVLPDLRLLRALIGRGVQTNFSHAGVSPLLAATRDSWHGRPEAVMTLLANGADPHQADADGNTPLHHAARSADPGVAALLRDAAAELDVLNGEGLTPLGVACAVGNWRLARFLLERGASAEVDGGTPAILAAAGGEEDDPAGVDLLLRHKARVDARDARGRSALHEAALAGHTAVTQALLDAGADVAARDFQQRTPLLEASAGARLPLLELLLGAGADPRAKDRQGNTALHLACQADSASPPLVQRLLALGVEADTAAADGRRPVDHAAGAGRWSLVSLLDPDYPVPSSVNPGPGEELPDRAPLALLGEGLEQEQFDGLESLSALVDPRELGGLLLPATGGVPPVARIEWLLAHGADAEVPDADGNTPLFALLSHGPAAVDAIRALLGHQVSPAGAGGLSRFLSACLRQEQAGRGLEQFALDLLAAGADPFAADADGERPLALSVRLGWTRLLEALIAAGVDLDASDGHGMTALHLAAALNREAALKALVRHGATPDVRAADGQTPLGVALSSGRRHLADWLDWRGWKLPHRTLEPSDLPAAAIVGDADALRRLLDLGFPVDSVDSQGCSALLRAAGGGHRAAVDLLLARGADPQRAAHTGATPLSAAVSTQQGEIVDRLIQAGAKLEHRLPGDVTVLMLAAALGLPDVCARLLTAGADVQATDSQGLTALHCAALYGFTGRDRARLVALFDTLLLAGAEVDAPAAGGVTPLLLLLGARAEPGTACDEEVVQAVLNQLLDEGATLDVQDPRGFGPLHLAGLHGLLQLARSLLRAGADPGLRDAINRTPQEIAVMRGFVDVAAELAPAHEGANVSMARFLRDRS